MIVADTDVLIDYLAGTEPVASRIELELRHAALATTVVSEFELLVGARSRKQQASVDALLEGLILVELRERDARRAADLRRALDRKGSAIPMADSLIAGIVLERRAILLTRNRRHFERIPEIQLGTL